MNTSQIRNQIGRKLNKIYKSSYSNTELKTYLEDIIQAIKKSNLIRNTNKNFNLSEKTSLLICYADSVLGTKNNRSIKELKKFYSKYLDKYFNTVHFLPFYPSSSDLSLIHI